MSALTNRYVTKEEAARVLNLQSPVDVEYALSELGEIYQQKGLPLSAELENPDQVDRIPTELLAELTNLKEIALESSENENQVPDQGKIQQMTGESDPITLAAIKSACHAMIQMGIIEGQVLAQRDHAISSIATKTQQATRQATSLSYVSTLVDLETDAITERFEQAQADIKELQVLLDPQTLQRLTANAGLTATNLTAQQKLDTLKKQAAELGKQ